MADLFIWCVVVVVVVQVYHMHCFCCSSCEKELVPGEQFGLSDGKLFCKSDFDLFQHDALDSPSGKPWPLDSPPRLNL